MRRMFSLRQLEEISKKVIESGLVENAKPIYSHTVIFNTNDKVRFCSCILNNSETEFTKDSLWEYIFSSENIRLLITGSIYDTNAPAGTVVLSDLRHDASNVYIVGLKAGTTNTITITKEDITAVVDNVFKIN